MMQFIKRLLKKPESKSADIVSDQSTDNYTKLKRLVELTQQKTLVLDGSRKGTGKIECHHADIGALNKTLQEINHILKGKTHLEDHLFSIGSKRIVYFDTFLLTKNGVYLDDPKKTFKETLRLIGLYLEYMDGAHKAVYGYMEYNHRRLTGFTLFLIYMLDMVNTDYA